MRNRCLSFISRIVLGHPWHVLIAAAAVTVGSLMISHTMLQMNTDQDDLVSESLPYHKRYKDYLREFGDLEYMYVVVETDNDLQSAKEFAKAVGKKLEGIDGVKEVTYRISNPKLEKSFLLYLPKEQLRTIIDYLPKMESIRSSSDVFAMMNETISDLSKSHITKHDSRNLETGFRFLDKLLDGLIDAANDGKAYEPFLQQAFFGDDGSFDEDGFLLSENGKLLFIMIMPEKNYKTLAVIDGPLKKIRAALDEAKKEFPNVQAGLTGRPVLAADEMSVSDTDMTIATIAALVIVTLIFIAYFRRPTRPAMAAIALAFGIAQTFGLATIVIGHLNILSIVFAVILVGAGIEFGLQLVSRYREELARHQNVSRAIETCIVHTGKGNMTACLTTAAAFFSMCFTDFLALQELGLIAGTGIMLCLVNMLTVLPAMMVIRDRHKRPEDLHTTLRIDLGWLGRIYDRPKIILAAVSAITITASAGLSKVGFDHNLLDLQAKGLESVVYEKKIMEESSQSTWYVPFIADSVKDSLALGEKVRTLPTVGRVETITAAVPEDQDEKIALIKSAASIKYPVRAIGSGGPASGTKALKTELERFGTNITRLTEMAFSSGDAEAVAELDKIGKKIGSLLQLLTGHEARINTFDADFTRDLARHIGLLRSGMDPERVTIDDMPPSIKKRYVSEKSGRIAFYAYPKEDIWDPLKMKAFIEDIRSVDINVTGVPVEVYESSKLLEKSFKQAAIFSMLAIVLIVAVDFKSLRLTVLALTPLFLGIVWLLEIMGLSGIKFNLANFFGIPIILGIGIDNAVQIVHRYLKDRHIETVTSFMTRSTGVAVLLTSITTFASFGTLIFARHQGIASLGLIMGLGTITCFFGSFIVLPCALRVFGPRE